MNPAYQVGHQFKQLFVSALSLVGCIVECVGLVRKAR